MGSGVCGKEKMGERTGLGIGDWGGKKWERKKTSKKEEEEEKKKKEMIK